MRVEQLGLQVQLKIVVDFYILGTESYSEYSALLYKLSGEKGIKDWVDILAEILNHKDITIGDSHLNLL